MAAIASIRRGHGHSRKPPSTQTARLSGRLLAGCLASAIAVAAIAQSLPTDLLERAQSLPAPLRAELQRHATALAAMTPAQRAAFQHHVAQWDALTPARQRERREAWQAWQAMPETERGRLRAAATAFAALPADQQQALRERFDALDGSERHGWLLGPDLGADYPQLFPLLAQVPLAQRDALLPALRGLSPTSRAELATLAQRIPPQERDALRTDLLQVPASQREAWLRDRLER